MPLTRKRASPKKLTIAEQRAAAEKRSMELLRAHVPDKEWHRGNRFGYGDSDYIEFKSQLGSTYRIWLNSTSENIMFMAGPRGGTSHQRRLCAGPYNLADYLLPQQYGSLPAVDMVAYNEARREAMAQGTFALQLPNADIWLGQYLSLKYNEMEFLGYARARSIY